MAEAREEMDMEIDKDKDSSPEEEEEEESADSSLSEEEEEEEELSALEDEEIQQLLEEGLPATRRVPLSRERLNGVISRGKKKEEGEGEEEKGYNEKEIFVLEDKGGNSSVELLPGGWIEVRHSSGMPVYLHRKSRICTLSKPYYLGPGSARRHPIPLSAVPCLAYRRSLEDEKEKGCKRPVEGDGDEGGGEAKRAKVVASTGTSEAGLGELNQCPDGPSLSGLVEETTSSQKDEGVAGKKDGPGEVMEKVEGNGVSPVPALDLPVAKVATAKENIKTLTPEELREYCRAVFKFKSVKSKRFKSWSARRRHTKEQKRIQLQRPTMPDGVKLISFQIPNSGTQENSKAYKEYIMNPQGKSSVCILHEYVQHALRKQPTYIFKELENAATPYSATVVINGMQYGTGYGSSKKQAKADAAKTALEILIPQMKEQLNGTKTVENGDFDILPFFEPYDLLEPGISTICKNFSEPPPYGLLLTCLQRNFGQDTSQNVKFEMTTPGPQSNWFKMTVGEHEVEVQAPNKREGKQLASQHLLAKLHPNVTNFGSFVKLYGNNSIKSVKEKKQEEQQITTLQSKASANSPNWAILSKLKAEMRKLAQEPAQTVNNSNSNKSSPDAKTDCDNDLSPK